MTTLSSDLREALAKVGTSTLTGVLNRRGLKSMTLFDVWPMRPEQLRLVGIAFTMRFIPSREDTDGPTSKNRSTIQPQAMEECPPGHVLMIDLARRFAGGLGGRSLCRPAEGARVPRASSPTAAFATPTACSRPACRPITAGRPRRPARSPTGRSTCNCRSPAAASPSIRATSWSATAMPC